MEELTRRRLRSASVQVGALTALALALSGCNMGASADDDDDCAMGPVGGSGGTVVDVAFRGPRKATAGTPNRDGQAAAVPDSGGFGTYLAGCDGRTTGG